MRFFLPFSFFLPPTPAMWLPAREVRLAHGQLLRVEQAQGWRVACREGVLLISQPGQWHENELRAGEEIVLGASGRVLIEGRSRQGSAVTLVGRR
jgi:hypothetical protein